MQYFYSDKIKVPRATQYLIEKGLNHYRFSSSNSSNLNEQRIIREEVIEQAVDLNELQSEQNSINNDLDK